jgi:hypothetical protein
MLPNVPVLLRVKRIRLPPTPGVVVVAIATTRKGETADMDQAFAPGLRVPGRLLARAVIASQSRLNPTLTAPHDMPFPPWQPKETEPMVISIEFSLDTGVPDVGGLAVTNADLLLDHAGTLITKCKGRSRADLPVRASVLTAPPAITVILALRDEPLVAGLQYTVSLPGQAPPGQFSSPWILATFDAKEDAYLEPLLGMPFSSVALPSNANDGVLPVPPRVAIDSDLTLTAPRLIPRTEQRVTFEVRNARSSARGVRLLAQPGISFVPDPCPEFMARASEIERPKKSELYILEEAARCREIDTFEYMVAVDNFTGLSSAYVPGPWEAGRVWRADLMVKVADNATETAWVAKLIDLYTDEEKRDDVLPFQRARGRDYGLWAMELYTLEEVDPDPLVCNLEINNDPNRLAWGMTEGFKVENMPVRIRYAAIAESLTDLIIQILPRSDVSNRANVTVYMPKGYEFKCNGDFYRPINFPNSRCYVWSEFRTRTENRPGAFQAATADFKFVGDFGMLKDIFYTVVTGVILPSRALTPKFVVEIRETVDEVSGRAKITDSAFAVPGPPIYGPFITAYALLRWELPMGTERQVRIAVIMEPSKRPIEMKLLNVELLMPVGFYPLYNGLDNTRFTVQVATDHATTYEEMEENNVVLDSEPKVMLDRVQLRIPMLPLRIGTYKLYVSCAYPEVFPADNFWTLNVDVYNPESSGSTDLRVSFPLSGFNREDLEGDNRISAARGILLLASALFQLF